MRKLFPGYYRPLQEEFEAWWKECIFSFDANMLLNIHRYSPKTRDRFFEVLEALSDRIWITHQAAYEYHKNRLNVISEQQKPYAELQEYVIKGLKKFKNDFQTKVQEYSKRHSFKDYVDTKQILKLIEDKHTEELCTELLKIVSDAGAQCPQESDHDGFRDKLDNLLDGNIGAHYSAEKLEEIYGEAQKRYKRELPPGYLDAEKKEPERYGDVVLWRQLIDYAKETKKPIIFVTDDDKDDWWQKSQGKTHSPRPELVQEMLTEAGVSFYLYTGDRFLDYAEKFLSLPSEPEVVDEAREIRLEDQQADSTAKTPIGSIVPEFYRVSGIDPSVYQVSGINQILEKMHAENSVEHILERMRAKNSVEHILEKLERMRAAVMPEYMQQAFIAEISEQLKQLASYNAKSRLNLEKELARVFPNLSQQQLKESDVSEQSNEEDAS